MPAMMPLPKPGDEASQIHTGNHLTWLMQTIAKNVNSPGSPSYQLAATELVQAGIDVAGISTTLAGLSAVDDIGTALSGAALTALSTVAPDLTIMAIDAGLAEAGPVGLLISIGIFLATWFEDLGQAFGGYQGVTNVFGVSQATADITRAVAGMASRRARFVGGSVGFVNSNGMDVQLIQDGVSKGIYPEGWKMSDFMSTMRTVNTSKRLDKLISLANQATLS